MHRTLAASDGAELSEHCLDRHRQQAESLIRIGELPQPTLASCSCRQQRATVGKHEDARAGIIKTGIRGADDERSAQPFTHMRRHAGNEASLPFVESA